MKHSLLTCFLLMTAVTLQIADTLANKLNKLRGPLPEAFFYWAKTSELMQ